MDKKPDPELYPEDRFMVGAGLIIKRVGTGEPIDFGPADDEEDADDDAE